MLTHGRQELVVLGTGCLLAIERAIDGWERDTWRLNDADVDAAVETYKAVLQGDCTADIAEILMDDGIDVDELLQEPGGGRDTITRSDVTELIAAATLLQDGWEPEDLHMPNIPKMARAKSDSGVDIFGITLADGEQLELFDMDHMVIASVKHTVHEQSASDVKSKLLSSLTKEMTPAYMMKQLRVLNGRLKAEGKTENEAKRVYLFLRSFPNPDYVHLVAVAAIDPDLEADLRGKTKSLPALGDSKRTFRTLLIPDLRSLHEKCP
ncbi:hypothetical protein HKX69_22425 [Streptomyces argyrophyllae]|uniref:DUF1837 domain-containing protein n=1 Tax=Streptomyces argyrophylli TaxID=2726118 RepID=A0A6M4PLU6_9ACTN|nr:hypothetical protein [Streptomyces argyrophyllae]QJS11902.1 hypothetical protein HKX69_22425 [Streptomyces argyrophyllae]